MIATSGFLTCLECTKFVFGRSFARTIWGSLQFFPRPSSWFKGNLLLRGRKGEKEEKRREGGKEEEKGEEKGK